MSTHPATHHEIAWLRHEERLVRAALVSAHPTPAEGVAARRRLRGHSRLVDAVRALFGAPREGVAPGVPRLQS